MAGDLLDLLCKAANEMRDFLRRERESSANSVAVDSRPEGKGTGRAPPQSRRGYSGRTPGGRRASARFLSLQRIQRAAGAGASSVEAASRAETSVARQNEIGMKQSQIEAVRGWTAAYQRTR